MVEALGLDLKEFIFYLINFLILVGVLGKFLYKPFLQALDNRKQTIADDLRNAAETNRLADQKLADYEERIARVEEEGREIIRESKNKAEEQAKRILADATEKAEAIKRKAEADVARERADAFTEMRGEIAGMALMAASKVLERELAGDDQQRELVDRVIAETGEMQWQN